MTTPEYLPTTDEGKLTRLMEECCEVGQIICKIQRFGIDNIPPPGGKYQREHDARINNAERLWSELCDLKEAVDTAQDVILPHTRFGKMIDECDKPEQDK